MIVPEFTTIGVSPMDGHVRMLVVVGASVLTDG
jgi:hypothetical protein